MKLTLNLATRPYLELGPIYTRLRLAMLALIVLGIGAFLLLRVEQAKARQSLARVAQVQQNIARLRAQDASYRALMQQPQNAAVLAQSEFLNRLFARKAFSWTSVMMDLETTLPTGVQVVSIDPVVAADGHVTVRLRVTGSRERAVEVVSNLEHSRHFLAPRLASEALANQTGNGTAAAALPVNAASAASDVSFDILADYKPLPHARDRIETDAGKEAEQSDAPRVAQDAAATTPASTKSVPTNPNARRPR